MIKIFAGGKKNTDWGQAAIQEYEKRLRKPFDLQWEFMPEDKFEKWLEAWPFSGRDFVIIADERGKNLSSPEFANTLDKAILNGQNIVILIGGAYGFSEVVRKRANLVWSFSRLVFPHKLARVITVEQIYRASQILAGGPYHHE